MESIHYGLYYDHESAKYWTVRKAKGHLYQPTTSSAPPQLMAAVNWNELGSNSSPTITAG